MSVPERPVTPADVIELNRNLLAGSNEAHGVLYQAGLESAVERPWTVLFGEEMFPTPFEKCAAMMWSLINNHPFHAANKRTAFADSAALMRVLSLGVIVATKEEIVSVCLAVEAKRLDTEDLSRWFVNHTR